MLRPINLIGGNFNVVDEKKFDQGLTLIKESLFDKGESLFCADNVITWNRNLSFLREDFFLNILKNEKTTFLEKSTIWRAYVLCFFAEIASRADGDYMELGCHTGYTADILIKKIDFHAIQKKYYLYDLFSWKEGDGHSHLVGHDNPRMYEDVVERFAQSDFVRIVKGSVPESFAIGIPDRVAFAHIDMNHPDPEVGALEAVLPRLSTGGVIVFDDYGWWGYSAQKMALDPIAEKYGAKILELPTGQGILIKR